MRGLGVRQQEWCGGGAIGVGQQGSARFLNNLAGTAVSGVFHVMVILHFILCGITTLLGWHRTCKSHLIYTLVKSTCSSAPNTHIHAYIHIHTHAYIHTRRPPPLQLHPSLTPRQCLITPPSTTLQLHGNFVQCPSWPRTQMHHRLRRDNSGPW